MSDKEVNLVNMELLVKFADAVSHKIDEHTGLLFFYVPKVIIQTYDN